MRTPQNPEEFYITTGKRVSPRGRVESLTWGQFVEKFETPSASPMPLADYLSASDEAKLADKAAPGYYVPARTEKGYRKASCIRERRLITLDIEKTPAAEKLIGEILSDEPPKFLSSCSWLFHSSRSHTPASPRGRLVILTEEAIEPEEYPAVSRIVASALDLSMEAFDPVSFRPAQVCFFPRVSPDQEYLFAHRDGKPIAVAPFVETHEKFFGPGVFVDPLTWPRSRFDHAAEAHAGERAKNPLEKPGVVGDWCRAYGTIHRAIEAHLSHIYAPTDDPNRYRHIAGSGLAGVVIYDDLWLYSHHTTDPCSQRLCNAWDAVRLGLFGDSDERVLAKDRKDGLPPRPVNQLPSTRKMIKLAAKDPVMLEYLARKGAEAAQFFDDSDIPASSPQKDARDGGRELRTERSQDFPVSPYQNRKNRVSEASGPRDGDGEKTPDWRKYLSRAGKFLKVARTDENVKLIVDNEPRLRGLFARRHHDNELVLMERRRLTPPPHGHVAQAPFGESYPTTRTSRAEFALRAMFSAPEDRGGWGIETGKMLMRDIIEEVAERSEPWLPAREKLRSLPAWDGRPRAATLFADYLAVEPTEGIRALAWNWMLAAVWRAMRPGSVNADFIPVLVGGQGTGKTEFVRAMAFSASIGETRTAEGHPLFGEIMSDVSAVKRTMYEIGPAWIVELPEMASMDKSSIEHMKAFVSKTVDTFRPAYGRGSITIGRAFVLIGTENRDDFLRDSTGNRRFIPVPIGIEAGSRIDIPRLMSERDQIWAEVLAAFRSGEKPSFRASDHEDLVKATEDHTAFTAEDALAESISNAAASITRERLAAVVEDDVARACGLAVGSDFGDTNGGGRGRLTMMWAGLAGVLTTGREPDPGRAMLYARAMRRAGFTEKRRVRFGKVRKHVWYRSEDAHYVGSNVLFVPFEDEGDSEDFGDLEGVA